MQKQLNTAEFGPNADTAQLTGNKEAKALADKAASLLSPAEEGAQLLAERNDVLDAAIERLGENGENWIIGYLAVKHTEDEGEISVVGIDPEEVISLQIAEIMRARGEKFCMVGAISSEYGPHSHKSIRAAINAIADAIGAFNDDRPDTVLNYGFGASASKVWKWNDKQRGGEVVIDKFRQAKSQPLRRD